MLLLVSTLLELFVEALVEAHVQLKFALVREDKDANVGGDDDCDNDDDDDNSGGGVLSVVGDGVDANGTDDNDDDIVESIVGTVVVCWLCGIYLSLLLLKLLLLLLYTIVAVSSNFVAAIICRC